MNTFYFEKIKRLHTLAEIGLEYSEIPYDQERYQEIRNICLEMLEKMTDVPINQIIPVIEERNGYRTPKVDIRAVVFNEKDQILLVKENVDGKWAMPGGWTDIAFSPGEVAEKECLEEAGLKVRATRLLAIMDKQKQGMPPAFEYVYKIHMLCEKLDDHISIGSETSDVGWFNENELPKLSLPRNTEKQIAMMYEYHRGERTETYFD
ncbi:NUDIX hydrolase N-terminal domain-containing protein [Prolixibacteraceae bacterium Z1-6]|uniref:NUDIX hydrolase N-terminal domain-containing protein n=1 Tax=Draconibacterium aestuarii TaxID=2998507 RepID=A0A9X3J9B2_9BACT|nr:NUDIX hydrolase N-terminal domain-containing protein [Prolixibacteraceae bacterium Z1-6]